MISRTPIHIFFALLCVLHSASAFAAEVRFSISARETYLGQPVIFSVEIENAREFQRPKLPEIAGIASQGEPSESRSTMMSVINGRTTQRETITLSYRLVPFNAGVFTIPPMDVVADGQTFTSSPIELIVTRSETGDLMFAEIIADRSVVYLGQPVRLTLRFWIKPYQDREHNTRFSAENMWNMVDVGASTWSIFAETLGQQRTAFGDLMLPGVEVLRDNPDGTRGAYFEYDITTTVWPRQSGPLTIETPTIIVRYPVRLARDVSFFATRRLTVAEYRPVSVTAATPAIQIKSPPTENQPLTFNGAVGSYSISTTATPTEVSVGDPITLRMTIHDESPSPDVTRLNLLQAPPLEQVSDLQANFRIPSDPMAGVVSGSTKTFTQTIRARHADVTQIPSIPLTFFDPETEQYVTRQSDPISITVKPSTQVGVHDLIHDGSRVNAPARPTSFEQSPGGILANYADAELLLKQQDFRWRWWMMLALLAPPLFVGLTSAVRLTRRYRNQNAGTTRKRKAASHAIASLKRVQRSDQSAQAQAVIAALSAYVGDRFNLQPGVFTTEEIVRLLNGRGGSDAQFKKTVTMVDELLVQCEQLAYAGVAASTVDDLATRGINLIKTLERSRWD